MKIQRTGLRYGSIASQVVSSELFSLSTAYFAEPRIAKYSVAESNIDIPYPWPLTLQDARYFFAETLLARLRRAVEHRTLPAQIESAKVPSSALPPL